MSGKTSRARAVRSAAPPTASGEGERSTSQAEQAYRQIEELIVTLAIAPGAVLTEQSLAKRLGLGRTPIREAVQRLAGEGLIVILPRRGILVSPIDVRSQLELLRLRREVERLMARYAAMRSTPDERSRFQAIAREMEQAATGNDDVGFMRLDLELNGLMARACRNDYAQKAMRLMAGLSRRFWYRHYKQALDLPRCARLHATLAKAVAGGDGRAAAQVGRADRLHPGIHPGHAGRRLGRVLIRSTAMFGNNRLKVLCALGFERAQAPGLRRASRGDGRRLHRRSGRQRGDGPPASSPGSLRRNVDRVLRDLVRGQRSR